MYMGSSSGSLSMKVHQFTRGLILEHDSAAPSLTLGCKRLRPLAPKLSTSTNDPNIVTPPFDLKSFIRPESSTSPGKTSFNDDKKDSSQVIYYHIHTYHLLAILYIPYDFELGKIMMGF